MPGDLPQLGAARSFVFAGRVDGTCVGARRDPAVDLYHVSPSELIGIRNCTSRPAPIHEHPAHMEANSFDWLDPRNVRLYELLVEAFPTANDAASLASLAQVPVAGEAGQSPSGPLWYALLDK